VHHGRPMTMARKGPPPIALGTVEHGGTGPCRCHLAAGCAGHLWTEHVDDRGIPWHVDPVCRPRSLES
jgi:hypothetical protein